MAFTNPGNTYCTTRITDDSAHHTHSVGHKPIFSEATCQLAVHCAAQPHAVLVSDTPDSSPCWYTQLQDSKSPVQVTRLKEAEDASCLQSRNVQ